MSKIDRLIGELTVEGLGKLKIFPLNVERETRDHLDDNHGEIELFGYRFGKGFAIERLDEVIFSQIVSEHCEFMVEEGHWIFVESEYFLAEDIKNVKF